MRDTLGVIALIACAMAAGIYIAQHVYVNCGNLLGFHWCSAGSF